MPCGCLRKSLPSALTRYDSWMARTAAGVAEPVLLEAGPVRLPATVLEESLVSRGQTAELAQLQPMLMKLCRGRSVRIGVAGASITYGHGIRQNRTAAWPAIFGRGLQEVWGGGDRRRLVSVRNAAVPATGANFAALCFDQLFPEPIDLLVIEYSLTTGQARKLRSLLQETRRRGVRVLALDLQQMIGHRAWESCRLRNTASGKAQTQKGTTKTGKRCTVQNSVAGPSPFRPQFLAEYRAAGIPVVSQVPVAEWARCGLAAHSDAPPSLLEIARWISPDGRHATRAAHVQMARMLLHAVAAAHGSLAASPQTGAGDDRGGHCGDGQPPSPPVVRDSFCSVGDALLAHVQPLQTRGWNMTVENDKAGLVATQPGSELALELPLTADVGGNDRSPVAGGAVVNALRRAATRPAAGPVVAYLSFLKSYEHMGFAEVSCAGGCECAVLVVNGHHRRRASLHETMPPLEVRPRPAAGNAVSAPPAACVLRLRVLANTSSGEHKVKLTALTLVAARFRAVISKRTAGHLMSHGA